MECLICMCYKKNSCLAFCLARFSLYCSDYMFSVYILCFSVLSNVILLTDYHDRRAVRHLSVSVNCILGIDDMDFLGPIPIFFHQPLPMTDTPIQIFFFLRYLEPILPWKSRILARAQLKISQRITLGTSNIVTPQFPCPKTLTNYIGVFDIGGPKALLFYRTDMTRFLSIG